MPGKRAMQVMILAVDVAGNGTPDRDVLGAGDNRQKITSGQTIGQNLTQRDTGGTVQGIGLFCDPENASIAAGLDYSIRQ